MTDNLKPDIDELVKRVNDQAEIAYEAQRVAREEQSKLNELWRILRENCDHQWVPDRDSYDPCRTFKICEICRESR